LLRDGNPIPFSATLPCSKWVKDWRLENPR
jgi:hypothetical protein